jgi:hypothetical protein
LDLEREVREKMPEFLRNEFEQMLHPVSQEDAIKLILVGTVLDATVGAVKLGISFALQTSGLINTK